MDLVRSARTALAVLDGAVRGDLGAKSPRMVVEHRVVNDIDFRSAAWDSNFEDRVTPEQLRRLYQISAWVHGGVSLIADAQAKAKFEIVAGDDVLPDHPAEQLKRNPNPFLSAAFLSAHRASSLELAGEAFQMLFFDEREDAPELGGYQGGDLPAPSSIWPLMPQWVTPIPDARNFISGYRLELGGRTIRVPAFQIIHYQRYDPNSLYHGQPAIRAIFETALADASAARYAAQFNRLAMRPEVAFSTTEEMDPEEARALKRELIDAYGGPDHAGEPMLLWSGLTPVRLAVTPVEAAIVSQREWNRDEILGAAFRLSKGHFGIVDDVNRATAEAIQYQLAVNVTEPKLLYIAATENLRLIRPFYGPGLELRYVDVVPTDWERDLRRLELGADVLRKNEKRELLGFDRVDDPAWDELPEDKPEPNQFPDGAFPAMGQRPRLVPAQRDVTDNLGDIAAAGATLAELAEVADGADAIEAAVKRIFAAQAPELVRYIRERGPR